MMMGRACRVAAVLAVALTAVAGCGEPDGPAPAAPPPPAAASVQNARDVRAVDPCALPTAEQLRDLGVDVAGAAVSAPEGRRCEWRGTGGRPAELGITLYTDGGGLEVLAENSEAATARVRLAGYPALETFTGTGEFCQYDVGVAPNQVVMASLQGGTPDSCTALQAVLPDLLGTLPAL
jgi:hypothetical protein